MAVDINGAFTPDRLPALPCGGIPLFDASSGCAYRCKTCFAVIGSSGMPRECYDAVKDEEDKAKIWGILKTDD